jgi:multidrug resistance efflux pump
VTAREELEADLGKAEADLAKAIADLVKANADLSAAKVDRPTLVSLVKATADVAKTEADLSTAKADLPTLVRLVKAGADVANAKANLSKARAHCLTVRIELDKLNYAEGKPISYVRKANGDRRRKVGATHARGHTNRRMAEADRRLARLASANLSGAKAIAESNGWTNQLIEGAANGPKLGTTARSSVQLLAWQTIQLFVLILAYLQYYFIDVNLQIALLPSVAVLLRG